MANFLEIQDCFTITRAFERGASYSTSEEAVFALLTNRLCTYNSVSKTIGKVIDRRQQNAAPASASEKEDLEGSNSGQLGGLNLRGANSNNATDSISGSSEDDPPRDDLGGIFDNECIPCGFRINFKEDLNIRAGLEDIGEKIGAVWERYLRDALNQILAVIDMFRNLDKYVDLCALLKFLKEYVCVPDLQKILAALMALLMNLSSDMNSIMDTVFSMLAPLFQPFLSQLVNTLEDYLLMILRPIECIIDAIINILGKLDYNVVFQNVSQTKVNLFGTREDVKRNDQTLTAEEVEQTDEFGISGVPDVSSGRGDDRPVSGNINPTAGQQMAEERRVAAAEDRVNEVRQNAANVDATDPEAYEEYKRQQAEAAQEYKDARRNRDLSAIGRAQQNIRKGFNSFRGSLFELVAFLREAVQRLEAFIAETIDEFQKLYSQHGNGSGRFVNLAQKKLALVQMIAMIKAIIDAFREHPDCEEDKEVDTYISLLPRNQGLSVWVDEDGSVNIVEDNDAFAEALEDVVAAVGGVGSDGDDESGGPSQKLKSLIELTGDPVLDTEIQQGITGLTTPLSAQFKCPLRTSVANAEKVNQWIEELNIT